MTRRHWLAGVGSALGQALADDERVALLLQTLRTARATEDQVAGELDAVVEAFVGRIQQLKGQQA